MADIDLSDAALTREIKDRVHGIFTIELGDLAASLLSEIDGDFDTLALFGRPIRAVQMGCDELAMEAVAVAESGIEHALIVTARRETYQDALLRTPGLLNTVVGEVALELLVDYVGRQEQCDLA